MKGWALFWGLVVGTLVARLVLGHRNDLPAITDRATLIVAVLVAATCLAAVVLVTARALIRSARRRHREPEAVPAPATFPNASLVARLDEAQRELAARNEHLAFVRELLQSRTLETERLAVERATVASSLAEARADAERWQGGHERVAAELQAERTRFASELTRLSDELLRGTLDASRRAGDLIEAQRELARRTAETEALRIEVMGLRAELARILSAASTSSSSTTPMVPPASRRWRSR